MYVKNRKAILIQLFHFVVFYLLDRARTFLLLPDVEVEEETPNGSDPPPDPPSVLPNEPLLPNVPLVLPNEPEEPPKAGAEALLEPPNAGVEPLPKALLGPPNADVSEELPKEELPNVEPLLEPPNAGVDEPKVDPPKAGVEPPPKALPELPNADVEDEEPPKEGVELPKAGVDAGVEEDEANAELDPENDDDEELPNAEPELVKLRAGVLVPIELDVLLKPIVGVALPNTDEEPV